MTHILPIRTGWAPGPGQDDLYPDDLPEDWRLAFFANEALGVLVPAETWRGVDDAELAIWREETPERFRLYLEVRPVDLVAARNAARIIAGRFGGLVGDADAVAVDWLGDDRRWVLMQPDALVCGPETGASGIALRCPEGTGRDLAAARRWIDSVTGALVRSGPETPRRAILCLLGACRLDELRRWQGLVELMGLSF